MQLQGQAGQRGYAMAALLVSIAVMAVLMSAAMPAYRHLARREKEAELAFRGEQYARAVALYRAKNGNAFPASLDILVQGRYLRKKYKDPMTKDGEFRAVPVGNPQGGQPDAGRGGASGRGRGPIQPGPAQPGPSSQTRSFVSGGTVSFVSGGIMGVASKSTETSIRIYKGQNRYDMWPFTFNMVNRPGGLMPGAGAPGGRGGEPVPGVGPGRGRGPGGRGPGGAVRPGRPGGPGQPIRPPVGRGGGPGQ